MAITSELIGKLGGGADVESTPVSIPELSGAGSTRVMHTVNIPPGETWLVAVIGTVTTNEVLANQIPSIIIGGKSVIQAAGYSASAAVMAESGDVVFRNNRYSTSSFKGNVYTVKL